MTNLGDLEVFTRIIALGSMTLAARALGLSPAVVSKRIKRLEERLGTRLFQRTTRQIVLTEAGEGFYARVVSVLAGLEEAEAFAAGRATDLTGSLRISAPTSFGRMHIAPHLKPFMQAHPNLVLHLSLSDDYVDLVGQGYDLAIRIGDPVDSSLVARKLAPVRRLLCASPDYLARRGQPTSLEDLKNHDCLPAHNHETWRLVGPEGPISLRPEGALITNSSEVVREAVLAGLGIALRSTWDIGEALKAGQLLPVLPAYGGSPTVAIAALYPSRQFLPAKVRLFIDYLADLYGRNPHWER